MTHDDDRKHVTDVLGGDKDAFGYLVKKYQKQIFNLMYRLTRSYEEAADLTQDAFIKAYEHLDSFDRRKKFFPWLYTIGVNHARDHARKKKIVILPDVEVDLEPGLGNPSGEQDRLIRDIDLGHVLEVMEQLPMEYREALILRYKNDMSTNELADILGLSPSGVKMRIKRALIRLRAMLGEKPDG